jgi:hypothetical protein
MNPGNHRGFPALSGHVRRGADWLREIRQTSLVASENLEVVRAPGLKASALRKLQFAGLSLEEGGLGSLSFARSDSTRSAAASASLTSII